MEHPSHVARSTKTQERAAFLLLTFVIFPLIAILFVAGYGFVVWFFQILSGPPGH